MERIEFANMEQYGLETFELLEYMQEKKLDFVESIELEDGRIVVVLEETK